MVVLNLSAIDIVKQVQKWNIVKEQFIILHFRTSAFENKIY